MDIQCKPIWYWRPSSSNEFFTFFMWSKLSKPWLWWAKGGPHPLFLTLKHKLLSGREKVWFLKILIGKNTLHLLSVKPIEDLCEFKCHNPSFGFATKVKGLQSCGPRGSPRVKAKKSQGCGSRRSPRVTSHTPGSVRKCEGVWGSEPSHS